METIKNYLDNLFAGYPKTSEILHAKEELFGNMEDKYNELKAEGKSENEAIGIVISEFGNIDELAAEWNIPTSNEAFDHCISVSQEEAVRFIEAKKKNGIAVAIGVMLCMLGVVLMILIGCFMPGAANNRIDITDPTSMGDFLDAITLLPLFLCVAAGVAVFIISASRMTIYEAYGKNPISISAATRSYVKTAKSQYQTTFTVMLTLGVVLCIMSPITLISIMGLFGDSDRVGAIGITVVLLFVAIAVFLFICSGEEMSAYKMLLQEEDYSVENKKTNKTMEIIGSIYWPIATIIYLGWSFTTWDWGTTWIVWPIAGILFGGIAAVFGIISGIIKSANQ